MEDAGPVTEHNPAQQKVLAALGARPHERPEFDPRLHTELQHDLEERLAPIADRLPDREVLFVAKHLLSTVHGCEGLFLAERAEDFAWSPQKARGTVSHKAIELSVSWRGDPPAGELVDEAIARLVAGDTNISDYLGGLRESERAELHGEAADRVNKFLECFPRLQASWRPVAESKLRVSLAGDRIVLSGKVDLTVGRAEGLRAGKVLVDLKTGSFSPAHREDLRFYALVETLRLGVPPRSLATYYLDGGRLQQELVSEALLRGAVERVVDGAETAVSLLHEDRAPVLKAGPPCRWCPQRHTCETGRRYLAHEDDLDEVVDDGW